MSELDESRRRREQCLAAMGITPYRLRRPLAGSARTASQGAGTTESPVAAVSQGPVERPRAATPPATAPQVEPAAPPPRPAPEAPAASAVATMDWAALEEAVRNCRACGLCRTRKQAVFGVGDHNARLLIVGEAPGAEEDRRGEPFVGRAGLLLDNMLAAIGLDRRQVYIANILKCRPPGNRNPTVEEASACAPYLRRQIELLSPQVIFAVGGVAAHNLLATDDSVGRLRRYRHRLPGTEVPVLVSYHPAYLLRRPEEKAKAWADLQKLHGLLEG